MDIVEPFLALVIYPTTPDSQERHADSLLRIGAEKVRLRALRGRPRRGLRPGVALVAAARPCGRAMRALVVALSLGLAGPAFAAGTTPPHLKTVIVSAEPWNVRSGGIVAFDVTVDESGAVSKVETIQDVAPYGDQLRSAVQGWRFEAARDQGKPAKARLLVIAFFRPPEMNFAAPERPRYKDAKADDEIPWPTSVTVPPYPPNVLVSGKVVLEADVSDSGRVTAASVMTPASPFDSAALDTAKAWVFRPAKHNGREVESRAVLLFTFPGTYY